MPDGSDSFIFWCALKQASYLKCSSAHSSSCVLSYTTADAPSQPRVACNFTQIHFLTCARDILSYCLASLSISFFFPLSLPSLSLSLSLTHTHTQRKPSSHLIAFPFFLRRDLWLGECWRQAITMSCLNSSVRQSGRGGRGDIRGWGGLYGDTLLLRTLPLLSPMLTLLRLPTPPCFHQHRAAAASFSPRCFQFSPNPIPAQVGCEAASALRRVTCLFCSTGFSCSSTLQSNKRRGVWFWHSHFDVLVSNTAPAGELF